MIHKKRLAQPTQQFTEFSHKPAGADSSRSFWGVVSSVKTMVSSVRYLQSHAYELKLGVQSTVTSVGEETHVEVVRDYTKQVPPPSEAEKQGIQIRKTVSCGVETQTYERRDSRTKKDPPAHQSSVVMTKRGDRIEIRVHQLELSEDLVLSSEAVKLCPTTPHSEQRIEIKPTALWCQEVSQLGHLIKMEASARPSQMMLVNEDTLTPVYFNYEIMQVGQIPPIASLSIQQNGVIKITLVPEQLPGLKMLQKLTVELYFDETTHEFLGVRGPLRGISSDALVLRDDYLLS